MTFIPGGCCDDYPECYHRVEQDSVRGDGTGTKPEGGAHETPGSGRNSTLEAQNPVPSPCQLLWCEDCQSHHTKAFGDEFHHRIISPRPSAQHKAECDCREFYGQACLWPACGSYEARAERERVRAPNTITVTPWASGQSMQEGDIVSFSGVYKRKPWWKFWRWFARRQLELFRVSRSKTSTAYFPVDPDL